MKWRQMVILRLLRSHIHCSHRKWVPDIENDSRVGGMLKFHFSRDAKRVIITITWDSNFDDCDILALNYTPGDNYSSLWQRVATKWHVKTRFLKWILIIECACKIAHLVSFYFLFFLTLYYSRNFDFRKTIIFTFISRDFNIQIYLLTR